MVLGGVYGGLVFVIYGEGAWVCQRVVLPYCCGRGEEVEKLFI